jgi:hypothetical protein
MQLCKYSTTDEFVCRDRAGILFRIDGSDVHHVVDLVRGLELHRHRRRRARARQNPPHPRLAARHGVQRMAVDVYFHRFYGLSTGGEHEADIVGVFRTSSVAYLYLRDDIFPITFLGRSYRSAENVRPATIFVWHLGYFGRMQKHRKDFVYHIWKCITRLVKTCPDFEEERSYAEQAVHGVYRAAIESIWRNATQVIA